MRIVSVVRLSREDEQSGMSPEAQEAANQEWIADNHHVCVGTAWDLGVSGEMPMRKRPDVGQWLTDERLHEWDGMVGAESARLFRDLADSVMFFLDFIQGHDKKLFTADGEIDMSTPKGIEDAFSQFLANQRELRKIKERNARSAKFYRENGFWHGGPIPFGFKPVKVHVERKPGSPIKPGSHWVLMADPDLEKLIQQIAKEIIAGKSVGQVARELTAKGIPTGRKKNGKLNTHWQSVPVARILRSPSLKGYVPYNHRRVKENGKLVERYELLRDANGEYMKRHAILNNETWQDLQNALQRPGRPAGKRPDASLLLHKAVCGTCGAWLHYSGFTRTYNGKVQNYRYYHCSAGCGEKGVDANELENWLDLWFTMGASEGGAFGDVEIIEHKIIPGYDYREELLDVDYRMSLLDQDAEDYDDQHARLRAERKEIKSRPTIPTEEKDIPTGIILKNYWPALSKAEKRSYLLRCEDLRIHARRNPDAGGPYDFWLTGNPAKVIGALSRKH
jgi:DNA invertase Pin-like site-specific DNA recombinase